MSEKEKPSDGDGAAEPRVTFDYVKSAHFRVIHADGAIGGLTPNGNIHMSIYSERHAIPQRSVYPIMPEGHLGKEIESERVSRDSVIREMDVDVILNLTAAKSFYEWLGTKIEELEMRSTDDLQMEKTTKGDEK